MDGWIARGATREPQLVRLPACLVHRSEIMQFAVRGPGTTRHRCSRGSVSPEAMRATPSISKAKFIGCAGTVEPSATTRRRASVGEIRRSTAPHRAGSGDLATATRRVMAMTTDPLQRTRF
jgi:hypothetical protein